MPAFYTHNYFAKKVYKKFDTSLQQQINYDYFLVFSQSFDMLYYKQGPSKTSQMLRKLGHDGHNKNTQAFFLNLVDEIKKHHNDEEYSYYLSFLYGMLTHYVLDSTFHPYIFYKTGTYKKDDRSMHKYNGLHTKYELLIDKYYYETENTIPFHRAKLYKTYDAIKHTPQNLVNIMNNVFKRTYYKENVGFYYIKCIKTWRSVTKYIKRDKLKIKRYLYQLIDKITGSKKRNIADYSYYTKEEYQLILNNEHKEWFNPADTSLNYSYSVDELMDIATEKYLSIINHVNDVLNDKENISTLIKYIPNISYFSGLDLSGRPKIRHFEF